MYNVVSFVKLSPELMYCREIGTFKHAYVKFEYPEIEEHRRQCDAEIEAILGKPFNEYMADWDRLEMELKEMLERLKESE